MQKHSWSTILAVQLTVLCFAGAAGACTAVAPNFNGVYGEVTVTNAYLVNPTAPVTGVINAQGCDAAVYFGPGTTGSVIDATIYNATQAGILNDGGKVKIDSNSVFDIGDAPNFTGAQHGYAIFLYGLNHPASGNVMHNAVWNYQKNGIAVRGPVTTKIEGNTVTGLGPTTIIAQNGIEVGLGAHAIIRNNIVSNLSYTGTNGPGAAAGILLFGGACYDSPPFVAPPQTDTVVTGNRISTADVGIWFNNLDASCVASVTTATRNSAAFNSMRNNSIFNVSGGPLTLLSEGQPYQAGISDQGKGDSIIGNLICGIGYKFDSNPPPYIFRVDTTLARSPVAGFNGCF